MNSLLIAIKKHGPQVRSFIQSLLLVAVLVVPGPGLAADPARSQDPPRRDVLLNGLRLLTRQAPAEKVVVVGAIRAGSMFDPVGKSGLANITAGLLTYGAGSFDGERIKAELSDVGATVQIDVDWDAVWITAECPPAAFPRLMALLGMMVASPRFAPEDVEAIKTIALERTSVEIADPSAFADRALARALYGQHAYGSSVWGDPGTIEAITPGDVKYFYNRFYGANSVVLGVHGPVDGNSVVRLVKKEFGRMTKKTLVPATFLPPDPADATRVIVVDRPAIEEAIVRIGFLAPGRSDRSAPVNRVVTSRLESDLRERLPNAEGLGASFDLRALESPITIAYRVSVDALPESLEKTKQALRALGAGDSATGGAVGRVYFPDEATRPLARARRMVALEYFAAQQLAPDPVGYTIDEAQIPIAARAILQPAAQTVVVVGNADRLTKVLGTGYKVEVVRGS